MDQLAAQAIKFKTDPDAEIDIDPDEQKEALSAKWMILSMSLESTAFGTVAGVEIDIFPNATFALPATHQIPKLQGWI